jgi:hypothetical protein
MTAHDNLTWRKASYSGGNGNCVEVAWPSEVAVRDSKHVDDSLTFPTSTWREFLASL